MVGQVCPCSRHRKVEDGRNGSSAWQVVAGRRSLKRVCEMVKLGRWQAGRQEGTNGREGPVPTRHPTCLLREKGEGMQAQGKRREVGSRKGRWGGMHRMAEARAGR